MNEEVLRYTTQSLLSAGKGILAADETPNSIGKRLESIGVENTQDNRRKFRELLFSTPKIEQYISGIILQDETIRQNAADGLPLLKIISRKNIIPGIKVDLGLSPFNGSEIETSTIGLDDLSERLSEYKKMGAKFAKWRSVLHISEKTPTENAYRHNALLLAEYAKKCQEEMIVPIVEPEVLMDGPHSMEKSFEVTSKILKLVFKALKDYKVSLSGMLLKPNMIIPGLQSKEKATAEDVARETIECFKDSIPSDLDGIVFLSGGQSDEDSVTHLNLMNKLHQNLPWVLSYSYGRSLQRQAMSTWRGEEKNTAAAQKAFIEQAELCSKASLGLL